MRRRPPARARAGAPRRPAPRGRCRPAARRPPPRPGRRHTRRGRAPCGRQCLPPRGFGSVTAVISSPAAGGLDMRRVARQAVEVGDRDHARGAGRIHRLDAVASSSCMATAMSLGCVAMQDRWADDGMLAGVAADGRAAAARLALVAGLVGVVEVGAAGALQQVAGGGRLVAQLAGGARQQRARQHRVVAPHARRRPPGRYCAPARRCAGRPPASLRSGPASGR
jgi:hypothetical protein